MTTTAVRKISNSNPSILSGLVDDGFDDLYPFSRRKAFTHKKAPRLKSKWKPLVEQDEGIEDLARGETPFSIAFSMVRQGEDSADDWE